LVSLVSNAAGSIPPRAGYVPNQMWRPADLVMRGVVLEDPPSPGVSVTSYAKRVPAAPRAACVRRRTPVPRLTPRPVVPPLNLDLPPCPRETTFGFYPRGRPVTTQLSPGCQAARSRPFFGSRPADQRHSGPCWVVAGWAVSWTWFCQPRGAPRNRRCGPRQQREQGRPADPQSGPFLQASPWGVADSEGKHQATRAACKPGSEETQVPWSGVATGKCLSRCVTCKFEPFVWKPVSNVLGESILEGIARLGAIPRS